MVRTAKQRRAENQRQARLAAIAAAERQRRTRIQAVVGGVVVLLLIVVVMVAVRLSSGNPNDTPAARAQAALVDAVTNVPLSTFNSVGAGSVQSVPKPIKGTPASGKPEMYYIGAEFCPFCAGERWALVAALSRFGTFTGLKETESSSTDQFPDTKTLSFLGSSYTSPYLTFAGYETSDRAGKPLMTVPSALQKRIAGFDSGGTIPFLYFDGRLASTGASYNVGLLHGLSHKAIATEMGQASSPVAQAVDGTVNVITAAICRQTGNKPGNVCTSPGVQAGARKLAGQ